jgi:hypothetical protein
MLVNIACEGTLDVEVVRRLLREVGIEPGHVYSGEGRLVGKGTIDKRLPGFIAGAQYSPWIVLRDLDEDAPCAGEFLQNVGLVIPRSMCFRLAVRSVEAWLLGDSEGVARVLGVREGSIPREPESLRDPKSAVISLAMQSKKKRVRTGLVPTPRSGRSEGVQYTETMGAFVRNEWNLAAAASRSSSLRRAVDCVERLRGEWD